MVMKKRQKNNFFKAIKMEIRQNKVPAAVYFILRAIVILVLIRQIFLGNYEIVPSLVQVTFRIEIPSALEVIILMFIFSAEILGEVNEFYIKIPNWDTMLHTLNGFLAAAIGFSLVNLLNEDKRLSFNLSPFFVAVVAFCFSMTIGVLWEFYEFFMDTNFAMDTQKDTIIYNINSVLLNPENINVPFHIKNITSTIVNGNELNIGGYLDIGLIDTMKDLIVNFIGAVTFSVIGYFYLKHKGKGVLVNSLVPSPKDDSNDYLKQLENQNK